MHSYAVLVLQAVYVLLYTNMSTMVNSSFTDSFHWIDEQIKLTEILQTYVNNMNARLDNLKTSEETLTPHAKRYATEEDLANNSLTIYNKTVNHLTVDHADVKKSMKKNPYDEMISGKLQGVNLSLLDDCRLQDAVRHMVHLQRVYKLSVTDMMNGRLGSTRTVEPPLTAEDCFYIGKTSAMEHDHEAAADWLPACEDSYDDIKLNPVSVILMSSSLLVGDLLLCKKSIMKCLVKDSHNRILHDLVVKISRELGAWQYDKDYRLWESFNTCAGDYEREFAYRMMKCRYNHHNSAFLLIAPLKEEMLSIVPRISIFRESLYDSEIERLKNDVYDKLEPGRVSNREGGSVLEPRYFPSYRSHVSLMTPEYKNLRNRLMEMNSLLYDEEETLQVIYYAPGGFIRVHSDFSQKTDISVQRRGHRIGQAVLYLNNVILGGETVFPFLKLNVRPTKGSVIAWTNMKVDGSEEMRSSHAGCPVIYGEKIIATQWFRMRGQDAWITKPEEKYVY